MKAITCSQCGATIKRIRIRDKYAHCDYCDAVMPIRREKVIEIPDPPGEKAVRQMSNWEIYQKRKQELANKNWRYSSGTGGPAGNEESKAMMKLFLIFAAFAGLIIVPIFLHSFFSSSEIAPSEQREETSFAAPTPCPGMTVWAYPTYLKSDVHKIEYPELDLSELPTCDEKELKTTIFSEQNNTVEVEITVNQKGDVITAEAISGHPFLHRASESAARRSLFTKRRTNEKRTIKYNFLF